MKKPPCNCRKLLTDTLKRSNKFEEN